MDFLVEVLTRKTVTPFLRGQDFPYMKAGSGWLTRSLEQSAPYNLEYPGNIRPPKLKTSFLEFVQEIQHGNPRQFILYFLKKLAEWRTLNATLTLARPTNRRIEEIVKIVERHWDTALSGVAKLPVLAIYAAYDCLVPEIAKFRECRLREMRSHTASDTRSNWLGDIQVEDKDGTTIEAVEVKHNIEIKANLISGLKDKIAASGLKTFYILSTNEVISPDEMIKMTSVMIEIRNQYGCQVIINGVSTTLRYYLRLVNSTDRFIRKYVDLIESDSEIPYDLKFKWNQLNSSTDA